MDRKMMNELLDKFKKGDTFKITSKLTNIGVIEELYEAGYLFSYELIYETKQIVVNPHWVESEVSLYWVDSYLRKLI